MSVRKLQSTVHRRSKKNGRAGFAVVNKSGTIFSCRVADDSSVYTTEQMAIVAGATEELDLDEMVALFTDSLSAC
jgi:hypothetical protein